MARGTGLPLMAGGLMIGAVFAVGTAAHADVIEPSGRCSGSATFAEGVDGPFTITSTELQPGDVVTVPLKDTVTWQGALTGVAEGTRREISGYVKVDMPWPLPDIEIDSWGGSSSRVANSEVEDYSLPSYTPRGVELRVYGQHVEAGSLFCEGAVKAKVDGGPFSSPFAIASVVLLAASAALAFVASRGARLALGGVAGFLTLLFAALALLFFGVLPLNSPLITILPVVGIPLGVLWGKLGLFATKVTSA